MLYYDDGDDAAFFVNVLDDNDSESVFDDDGDEVTSSFSLPHADYKTDSDTEMILDEFRKCPGAPRKSRFDIS